MMFIASHTAFRMHLFNFYHLMQYATKRFTDMNTNPAPERIWSLSSKEVKALSHASASYYVYALTEAEVSE